MKKFKLLRQHHKGNMKLNICQLEHRCTPVTNAVGDFGNRNGYQYTMDNRDFVPFPDFMASQFSAYADGYTVIGAAPGGGPRVQQVLAGQLTLFPNT